jgi:choline dehydrogenase
MHEFNPVEFMPGPEIVSPEDISRAAGNIATTIFHPVGTAKMDLDDMAVVNPELFVWVHGLRIADCSIMSTIVSGNTHAPR